MELEPTHQSPPKERVVIITSSVMSFITMPQAVAIVFSVIAASAIIVVDIASLRNQLALVALICAGLLTILYRWFLYLATDRVLYADLYRPLSETSFSQFRPILTAFQLMGRLVCGTLFTLSAGYYLLYTSSSIYISLGGTENIEKHFSWIVTLFSVTLLFLQYRTSLRGKEAQRKRTVTIANIILGVFFFFTIWILLNYIERGITKPFETLATSFPTNPTPTLFNLVNLIVVTTSLLFIFSNEDILWQVHRELEAPKRKNYLYTFLITTALTIIIFTIAGFVLKDFPTDYFEKNWRYATYLGILSSLSQTNLVGLILRVLFSVFILVVMLTSLNYTNRQAESQLSLLADNGYLPVFFKNQHPQFGTNSTILLVIFCFQSLLSIAIFGNFSLLAQIAAFTVGGGIVFTLFDFEFRFKQEKNQQKKPIEQTVNSILSLQLSGFGLLILIIPSLIFVAFHSYPEAALIAFLLSFGFAILAVQSKQPFKKSKLSQMTDKQEYELTETKGISQDLLDLPNRNPILVAARHPQGLHHLRKVLTENKTGKQDVVVVTVRITREPSNPTPVTVFGRHEKTLFQEVLRVAQECGTKVTPIVVTGTNSLEAIIGTALNIKAKEIVLGMSGKVRIEEQIEEFTQLWRKNLSLVEEPVKLRIITPRQEIVYELEHRSM